MAIRTVKSTVSVTREQRISATPADVWAIVADPSMQERLDPRCRVESVTGDWWRAGAEFIVIVRGVRLRYVVTEAVPGFRWTANVGRGGKHTAVQSGELIGDGPGTLLRWTVGVSAGPLMRRLVERTCERELPHWLAAVEREVLARVG